MDAEAAADTFILVPTTAAARQLTRTLDETLPGSVRPLIGTRSDLYDALASRVSNLPRPLSAIEREAVLAACAGEAEAAGHTAPFHIRPALVAEMLALYDRIRDLGRTVDDFGRLLIGELEQAAETDRGAWQLLEQTRFLSAAFRSYEQRLWESNAVDQHGIRAHAIAAAAARPLRHLVLAVGDQPFDTAGYWPADVTLFTTIPGLERLDVLTTETVLESGYLERARRAFVEIEEGSCSPTGHATRLIVPDSTDGELVFSYRDREDELEAVVRRLKGTGSATTVSRTAIVVARPLPYLYLAREVFASAQMPFEALDTLPLAAEPYAAAVDVVLECAAANLTRRALMALLRSPHFQFALERSSISQLDAAMAAQRYLGGLDRLAGFTESLSGGEKNAATVVFGVARELAPLIEALPLAEQIDRLRAFLAAHDRPHQERRSRARAAVWASLDALAASYRRHNPDATGTVTELSGAVRRWLGGQTFAVASAGVTADLSAEAPGAKAEAPGAKAEAPGAKAGVRILDAQAARFADLDEVQIVGLIEGEWPERPRRNIFYPRALLAELEPARPDRVVVNAERDQVRAARAMFRDLLGLAQSRTRLSTFALESDAVVEPSTFIDELPLFDLATERETTTPVARAFSYETLLDDPAATGLPWAMARSRNAARQPERFTGEAGDWTLPRVSVSRVERYLKCPFQFYVGNVLRVEEEPEDENSRSPLERGRFLHELFETFFHEWQLRGRGRITSREMADARALFAEIAEPALRSLSPAEAALERARLFGSAVGSGIADRVFAMEAERGIEIRERLMEYELDGEFTFTGEDGSSRAVRLRAKIDRVDVLGDGTFRLIDYKTKYVPDRRTALQLPIYSACVRTSLSHAHGRDIPASEAMYLSFEGPQAVVPLDPSTSSGSARAQSRAEARGKLFDELTTSAGHRLVAALDDIARGHYPQKPETKNLCTMCGYVTVCRTPGGIESEDTEQRPTTEDTGRV
jgi:RecB family exonuclease/inactivated superfamily I helicase